MKQIVMTFSAGWNGWTEHRLIASLTYYFNALTKESRWSTPPDYQAGIGHLNRDEIQVSISRVSKWHLLLFFDNI